MDTKPTPTLAKLHVSQEKFDYALAIYLYLQEKEGRNYTEEITEAVTEICNKKWGEYPRLLKKIFSKEDAGSLHIVPEELYQAAHETLQDIKGEFEPGAAGEIAEGKILPAEQKESEEQTEGSDFEPEKKEEESPQDEQGEEELHFPNMGDAVFEEPERQEKPAVKETKVKNDELVPGLDDFTSNYKKEVSEGLIEESETSGDEKLDKKLQDDIDQKLINVLRIMRRMSVEELRKALYSKLEEGRKLEDLTLADLEEILD